MECRIKVKEKSSNRIIHIIITNKSKHVITGTLII